MPARALPMFAAIAVALVLAAADATAATYYVAPTGSDANVGTAVTAPWHTLAKVAATPLAPGDTVLLRAGVYAGYVSFTRSGTTTSPITIAAYPGEIPIVDGTGGSRYSIVIHVSGACVTLRGLEIRNFPYNGIMVNADRVVVDRVHVHNGFRNGIGFDLCSYGTVTDCVVHDLYDYDAGGVGGGGYANGIVSSAGDAPTTVYGWHIFRNNLVYNCSDDGIDTWTSQYNTIEGNVVHHSGYSNASDGGSATVGQPVGDGNGFKLGPGGNNLVTRNVSYANRMAGFTTNSGANTRHFNNTAYQNGAQNFITYQYSNTYRNNLSYAGTAVMDTGPEEATNSWNLGITDPHFASTDPTSPQFLRLAAGSPAIDRGLDVGLPYLGSAPDLGAYEYGGVTPGDTTAPVLTAISVSSTTSSGAVIGWTTDEAADSQVDYGTTTAYGASTTLDPARVVTHAQTLTGLAAGTLHHYRVRSRDAAGNLALSPDRTLTTATVGAGGSVIPVTAMSRESGFAYYAAMTFPIAPDTMAAFTASTLRVFEDGREVGPAHAAHADIRTLGGGRFSHWGDGTAQGLYFSTSDNSDPRANGRRYTFAIGTTVTRAPYDGTPHVLPGVIQAEDFDHGGEGVAYHDLDATNAGGGYRATGVDVRACIDAGGGWQVGWFGPGEWLEYTVSVGATGSYDVGVRGSVGGSGATIRIAVDGVDATGALAFATTGGWDTFRTVRTTGVRLAAGAHLVRLTCESGALDCNWLSVDAPTTVVSGQWYRLTAKHSGRCLDVAGASTANATNVQQWTDNGTSAQQWRIDALADGTYTLTARCSGQVLDIAGGSTADGGDAIQYPLHGGANQRWRIEDTGTGWFRLVNVGSGKVLHVGGAETGDGGDVVQWTDLGGDQQRWSLTAVPPSGAG